MSASRLKRRLREVQMEWRRETRQADLAGDNGFMPGVVRGLAEALRIVGEFQKEDLCKTNRYRSFTRSTAILLYDACRRAYGRLKNSDRFGAMQALKKALDNEHAKNQSNP